MPTTVTPIVILNRPSVNLGLLLLRIGIGGAFVVHGAMKLQAGEKTWAMIGSAASNIGIHASPTTMGFIATLVELIGGGLLVLGLLTRLAAFVLMVQMIVAITFHFHVQIPDNPALEGTLRGFASGWSHPLEDGLVFLALIFTGAGQHSLDAGLFSGRRHDPKSEIEAITHQPNAPRLP